jgi:hypothetical protein
LIELNALIGGQQLGTQVACCPLNKEEEDSYCCYPSDDHLPPVLYE